METTITTWTQLFGYSWESAYIADPNGELDLTDEQRTEFDRECERHLEVASEVILNQIDASAYVYCGSIVAERFGPLWDLEDWSAIKEEIGMIDFDEIIDRHIG